MADIIVSIGFGESIYFYRVLLVLHYLLTLPRHVSALQVLHRGCVAQSLFSMQYSVYEITREQLFKIFHYDYALLKRFKPKFCAHFYLRSVCFRMVQEACNIFLDIYINLPMIHTIQYYQFVRSLKFNRLVFFVLCEWNLYLDTYKLMGCYVANINRIQEGQLLLSENKWQVFCMNK